ncbi:MAG: S9 family peptidase [Acidobacteria bacterium]|nr:S9 family peptidase [Acidobacteriota bacterium]
MRWSKFITIFCLLMMSLPVFGQGQGPLIDRELFFGDPEIGGAQISPDGKFIAFVKPYQGTRNIWVKGVAEPFGAAKLITNDTKRPIPAFFWSRDGRFILFVQDQGGNENFNVYAVNPAEAKGAGPEVPAARNLTEAKSVRAIIYALPKSNADLLYVGMNDRDQAWHDLYQVKISTGERKLLRQNTERLTGWVFDQKDQLRLATRAADNGDTEVLRVDPDGFKKVYSCSVFENCGPVQFHKDNQRVYMVSDRGAAVERIGLILFNPSTGTEELVESDPQKRVDLATASFSDKTGELIATIYQDERTRIYWKNADWQADYEHLQKQFPGREIGIGSMTTDENLVIASVSSDTEPGESYLYDRKTRKLTLQYRLREKLAREQLAKMEAVSYPSSDGLEIPAFLTLPKGVPAKGLPVIIFPHGGPWARDGWGYDSFAQFLANRGYAVLQPNFRGSTGYGKKFLNAGNLEWGQKMQDDLTWGAKYLIGRGIADPKRVGIMGGSYGGYATLAGLAFTPDTYACGVSIVGPSNLLTLLDSIPPYWEAARKLFHERMGDPNTPEGKARLQRQSPLNSASKIKSPLLVIQGANDPRVKQAESDQIVVALRDRGFPVEYLVAPDEGHGFARPVNNLASFALAEKFLSKHLGGRHQEEMRPEQAARLKEITVDVKTVVLKKALTVAAMPLKPVADLKPGTVKYSGKIEVAGQTIPFTAKTEIGEDGGKWVITEAVQLPQGEMTDKTTYEKSTLVPLKRQLNQGPVTIEVAYEGSKAKGSMAMNGQSRPFEVDLGGVVFADGAGSAELLATLPLTEGFTTVFRNFDLNTQKPSVKELKVVGVEKVTVPAGTFDAYKVEVADADGGGRTTYWFARDGRRSLKTSAVMPQFNGAIMTIERVE